MKRKECCAVLWIVAFFLCVPTLWSQGYTTGVRGIVTKNGEPVPNLQIVMTSLTSGKEYKTKTDKKGQYFSAGMIIDEYVMRILGANGDVLYVNDKSFRFRSNSIDEVNIDLGNPEASKGRAGTPADAAPPANASNNKKMSKEQQKAEEARIKAQNEKINNLNGLIMQYQTAIKAQNYVDAEKAVKQIVETVPDTTRWEFFKALGDLESQNNELADALKSYDKGIERAQSVASGTAPKDPFNPNADPAAAKAGIGQILLSEGNTYVKLGKPEMATPLFQQAGQDSPNPGLAFYNLCAVEFNANKMDEAIAACDKAIAADPSRADAWFLKGSALYKAGKPDSGKGVSEALNKYLQLDPNGQHATEARSILQMPGIQK